MFCCTSIGSTSLIGRKPAPEMAGEHVQLLQIGVGEGQHLRQEGVEPHVVGELAAELVPLVLRQLREAVDHRSQAPRKAGPASLSVEVDLAKPSTSASV